MDKPQPIGKSIGQVLTERKEELKMTDDQIADIIGRTGSYVALLRKGAVGIPQIDTVFNLVKHLGIPLDQLMPGYEEVFKLSPTVDLAPFLNDAYGIRGKEWVATADKLLRLLAEDAQHKGSTDLIQQLQEEQSGTDQQDQRLINLIQRWPQLTEEQRQAISVLIKGLKLFDTSA